MLQEEATRILGDQPDRGSDEDSTAEDKLQYTIKGIERRSIELMRDAARQEGMKIGAWVSRRLREAAEASLADQEPDYSRELLANANQLQKEPEFSPPNVQDIMRRLDDLQNMIDNIRENQRALISGLIARGPS
jgi:hypothetical protein